MNPDDHLLPGGTRLNNLYEIEEHIADGGIGTVYRARDVESGDPVAIKVLLATFAKDPMILDLFKREAKILRKLKHDALTQYFVFAKEPTLGVYYLAMEFVGGPSLKTRLESGPLEPEAVYRLVVRLASALQAVHDREVIHRDLSPDNIILQNGDVGQAKIIDFGISRANTAGPTIIGDGFAGKVNYVSPEQVGLFDGKVTAKSDIYSLGLVINEALTGKQTDMGGTQVEMIEKRRIVPSLDGVDNRFRPLLEAMLQPDPANRPASMTEIAEWTLGAPLNIPTEEKTIIRSSGPPPEQTVLDEPLQPARWGRRILVAFSLLGFAGVGAAGVYFLVGQGVPEQNQKPVLVAQPRENAPDKPVQPPVSGNGSVAQGGDGTKVAPPDTQDQVNQPVLPDPPVEDPVQDSTDIAALPVNDVPNGTISDESLKPRIVSVTSSVTTTRETACICSRSKSPVNPRKSRGLPPERRHLLRSTAISPGRRGSKQRYRSILSAMINVRQSLSCVQPLKATRKPNSSWICKEPWFQTVRTWQAEFRDLIRRLASLDYCLCRVPGRWSICHPTCSRTMAGQGLLFR